MVSYVVTGASRGIGFAFVKTLTSNPKNQVFALVRNKTTATQLDGFVESQSNPNKNVVVLEADLEDRKSIKTAAEEVSKVTGGKLDVLINNAALLHHERKYLTLDTYPDEETLENDFLLFFKTNVIGITHTINAFLPLLRAGERKRILVVTSALGSRRYTLDMDYSKAPSYSISKAAVNMVVAKTFQGPPEVVDKIYEQEVALLRQKLPSFPGVITAEQSVAAQLALLEKITPEDSGAFLDFDGSPIE